MPTLAHFSRLRVVAENCTTAKVMEALDRPRIGEMLDLRPQAGIDRTQWKAWKPTQPTPRPPDKIDKAQLENIKKMEMVGDEKGMRRTIKRRTVDYGTPLIRWQQFRKSRISPYDMRFMRPNPNFVIDLFTPNAYPNNASVSIATKFVHTSTNKVRCPVNVVRWTPDGRRLLTGSSSGEFTLWNGLTFNFETILQAHDSAVRSMSWSHSDEWLVSGDHGGIIKYWQPNMNNLNVIQGHREAVRDVTFCPNDTRFATASDDGTIKIWDFNMGREERDLKGHGWDVKCVDWHPSKGLLVSGSKDNLIKFWDPRSGKALNTLHGHKNTVMSTKWSVNGDFMASVSRDQTVKVYDLRTMKEYATLRGHKKEVNSVTWHPVHTKMLVTGGSEGSIMYWLLDQSEEPVGSIDFAHESNVWSLAWHPIGHLLCSGSNDHTTRFWSRNRPGEEIGNDRWSIGREKAEQLGIKDDDVQDDNDFVPGLRTLNGPGQEANGAPFGGQAPWGNSADGGIPGLDGRGPPQNRYRPQGGYGDRYQDQDRGGRYGGQGGGGRGGGWQQRGGGSNRGQQGGNRGGSRYGQGGGGGGGGGGGSYGGGGDRRRY